LRRNQRSSRNDPIVALLQAESPLGVKGGGRAVVEFAAAGKSAVMPAIRRISDAPYRWNIIDASLSEVANQERLLPADFISADGFGVTAAARRYLAPLIVGEAYPPFKNGLPDYVKLRNVAAPKKAEHGVRRLKTVTSRWRSRTAQGCRPPFVGSEPAHQSDSELHPAPYGYLGAPKTCGR